MILKFMNIQQASFYLWVLALFLCLVAPSLLSDGMFVDGVTYAAISNNLAHGMGSFWDLHYTQTLYPHFHEHPPLAFGLQGLFFSWFGSSYLVERFFSLATFLFTGWILVLTWNRITGGRWTGLGWLPLLFWITVPLVSWAASNNLLENTMMIFTSLSVFFIFQSRVSHRILFLCLAGVSLFLGTLTKGFVSLFTLTLPAWMWIFGKAYPIRRAATDTMIFVLTLLLPFLVIFLIMPESLESLRAYLETQVLNSLRNVRTVDTRFYIVWRLFLELLPGLALIGLLYIVTGKRDLERARGSMARILIALGLSGVLPVMISLKQRGFYIQATFPIFALALAILAAPRVQYLVDKLKTGSRGEAVIRIGAPLLLLVSIFLNSLQINRIGRDWELIGDIRKIIATVPRGSNLAVSKELWENWALHAYLQRYAGISLDSDRQVSAPYLLKSKGADGELPEGYIKDAVELNGYKLYTRAVIRKNGETTGKDLSNSLFARRIVIPVHLSGL
jgi:hypothetical protein